MPIRATPLPFTAKLIAGAPEAPGVYALWRDGEVIYIGHAAGGAATLRSRLVDHFSGIGGACMRRATHYSWLISRDPARHEAEALAQYQLACQRLPLCNASQ